MFRASTGTVKITPDEPLWLAGFAARTEPARGTLSDLYASALALEDSAGQRFVIASMDIIAIPRQIADPVVATVHQRHNIPRERFILAATHTHYGPEFRPDKELFFGVPPEYAANILPTVAKLTEALTRVILQAL